MPSLPPVSRANHWSHDLAWHNGKDVTLHGHERFLARVECSTQPRDGPIYASSGVGTEQVNFDKVKGFLFYDDPFS
jgi:hypothetical protein